MDKFDISDFLSRNNLFLIPPYINGNIKIRLKEVWESQDLDNHVFLCSSGTTASEGVKTYAISKEAILSNANAVNEFLNISEKDVWLSSLPFYHIGGLSIFIRAYLSNSKVVLNNESWDPYNFLKLLKDNKINFASLVPTQLFDLVQTNKKAPKDLKGIFIGGDFLSDELKERALVLEWPIIQTYGMTESSSQIASEFADKIQDSKIPVLPIHKIKQEDGKFFLSSPSLFTRELIITSDEVMITTCKNDFEIKDNLLIEEINGKQYLKPLGRKGDEFKLKGRLFNFLDLKNLAHEVFIKEGVFTQVDIALIDDEREGKQVILLMEEAVIDKKDDLIQSLNAIFPKSIDVKLMKTYKKLPRTKLGKLKLS